MSGHGSQDSDYLYNKPKEERKRTPKGYLSRAQYTDEERAELQRKRIYENPAMTKHNRSMTDLTRLASQLNWARRCLMGLGAQVHNGFYWLFRSNVYNEMSDERKAALVEIDKELAAMKAQVGSIVDKIDAFKNLPKWAPEAAGKHLKPSRRSPSSKD